MNTLVAVSRTLFCYLLFYLFLVIGEPPKLLQMPSEVVVSSTVYYHVVDVAANLVIQCNVSGTPTPIVTWFKGGIPMDGRYISGHTLFLNVTEDVEASQSGVSYYCLATNRMGPVEFTVRSQNILVRYNCEFIIIIVMCKR